VFADGVVADGGVADAGVDCVRCSGSRRRLIGWTSN
jgi:hypothetical protein